MTLGDRYPRLYELPGYEEIASQEVYDFVAVTPTDPTSPAMSSAATEPAIRPEVRDAVLACPDRGTTLPPDPDEGCCGSRERTVCRAGKGLWPGQVTLAECLDCKSDEPVDKTSRTG